MNPLGDARSKFSIQFFLVAILFLIFDLEVIFLFPFAVSLYHVSFYGFWIAIIFLVILTVGFCYEFSIGALKFHKPTSSSSSSFSFSSSSSNSPPSISSFTFSVNSAPSFNNIVSSSYLSIRPYSSNANNSSKVVPIKIYSNADTQKVMILKENKGLSGIYRLVNILNGKAYIGSAVNISKRMSQYYSSTYLNSNKMAICSALLKYGHSSFSLDILEYCNKSSFFLIKKKGRAIFF